MIETIYTLVEEIETEFGTADSIIENEEGEWLAFTDGDEVFAVQDNGEYIPAPANWKELVNND